MMTLRDRIRWHVCLWQILLQKSFCEVGLKFSDPWVQRLISFGVSDCDDQKIFTRDPPLPNRFALVRRRSTRPRLSRTSAWARSWPGSRNSKTASPASTEFLMDRDDRVRSRAF